MLRDNFFKMSMQKPLQHSFVYGSVWPTILKDKDTTKTENVKVLIVTNTWTCEVIISAKEVVISSVSVCWVEDESLILVKTFLRI